MLNLHASWLAAAGEGQALALWAESDALRRRAGGRAGAGAPAHPFAATVAALRDLLARVEFGGPVKDGEAVALLPSRDGGPIASFTADLAAEGDGAGEVSLATARHGAADVLPRCGRPAVGVAGAAQPNPIAIAPYRVPCLLLDAAAAVDLLTALTDEKLGDAAGLGADLRFWQQAALFALSLLTRQRFLPDLRIEDGAFVARWRALIAAGSDADRLVALAAAMPPAACALVRDPDRPPTGPRTLLRGFVQAVVDALARRAVAGRLQSEADATAAQAWLAALCGKPRLSGRPVELSAFRAAYLSWSSSAGGREADASFRLCFRLRPPEAASSSDRDGDAWRLDYLMQAIDDPSLLVPLSDVWQTKGSAGGFLDRRFDHPQERALASLGRAARLFAPVERSLRGATPESVPLESAEAYRFVSEAGPVLSEAGFGVLVPGMDNRVALRLKLSSSATPSPKGGVAGFGWNDVVSFDWEVAIGGQVLSRREFEALVALKAPLVNVRGQWVELRPDAVEKTLTLLHAHDAAGEMSLAEALRLALAPEAATDLPVERVELDGAFERIVTELRDGAAREELTEPPGFTGSLRPYQRNGLSWLAALGRFGLGACLADDMGLGKTVQLIAALLHRRELDPHAGPALLICPTSVVANWRRELERFAPSLRALVHHARDDSQAAS